MTFQIYIGTPFWELLGLSKTVSHLLHKNKDVAACVFGQRYWQYQVLDQESAV